MKPLIPLALVLALPPVVSQTQATWLHVSPLAGPSTRWGHAMAYDSVRGRTVLFGGADTGTASQRYADTWEWDGTFWSRRLAGNVPTGRYLAACAFDLARGTTVLFGGADSPNGASVLGDTWLWDGFDWSRTGAGTSPSPRQESAMCYDSIRQRIVLFGGCGAINGPTPNPTNDTWEWDGTRWIQRAPATVPPTRHRHGLAFDASRGRTVLYGGVVGNGPTDVWEWDGTDWSVVPNPPNSIPYPRDYSGFSHDTLRHRTTLLGGISGGQYFLADLWDWDGISWSRLPVGNAPDPRASMGMVYDERRGRLVIFGGRALHATLNDTWELAVDARLVGRGHPGGGVAITCVTPPVLGSQFGVAFPSSASNGLLILGPGGCDTPLGPIDPPITCSRGSLFPIPLLVQGSTLDPALVWFALPLDARLLGTRVCLQGMALQPGNCFRMTDAIEATLRLP